METASNPEPDLAAMQNEKPELPVGPIEGRVIREGEGPELQGRSAPVGPIEGPVTFLPEERESQPVARRPAIDDRFSPVVRLSPFDRRLLVVTLAALTLLGLLFLYSRALGEFVRLYGQSPLAAWAYLGVLLTAVLALGTLAGRSWARYQRLRDVTQLQRLAADCRKRSQIPAGADKQLRRELEQYLVHLERHSPAVLAEAVNRVRSSFSDYVNDGKRDLEVMNLLLLDPIDEQVDAVVDRRAAQTAVATAMASSSFDPLIVSWQSLRLVHQVSQLYGGRPGVWGTLRLLRRGMTMVVFADLVDLAAQAAAQAATGVVTSRLLALGSRATEGLANGLLMLRLGEAVKEQCRPIPSTRSRGGLVRRLVNTIRRSRGQPLQDADEAMCVEEGDQR